MVSGCGSGRDDVPDERRVADNGSSAAIEIAIARVQSLAAENQRLRDLLRTSDGEARRLLAEQDQQRDALIAQVQLLAAQLSATGKHDVDFSHLTDPDLKFATPVEMARRIASINESLGGELDREMESPR